MIPRCVNQSPARFSGVLVEAFSSRYSIRSRAGRLREGNNGAQHPCSTRRPLVKANLRSFATVRLPSKVQNTVPRPTSTSDPILEEELRKAASIIDSWTVPSETVVQNALQRCENLARGLTEAIEGTNIPARHDKSSTSNLLSLEEQAIRGPPPEEPITISVHNETVERISTVAYNIVTDPKIFMTPHILATYVYTQTILNRPQSFPKVFDLYASKPIPQQGTSPITFKEPNPSSPSAAVPLILAHDALNLAIKSKDLALCLSIVNTSVCTPAFKRAKTFRRALLPFTALALSPPAAYVLASQLAQYQDTMDPQLVTSIGTVGILAYIGFTATIGVVAITTANDQMDRITWAMGTPLRERWIREEERAFVDRIAGSWGFQNREKRGEEEGTDWAELRQWAGSRGLILDKPELMDGME